MMKTLFNSLSALATPIGYIIHVGAGQCSELQSYQDLDPQKIILIEADAQQVTQLKSITQAQNNIKVIACAVADKKEAQTLKILSNPRDSSLLMPEKILDYYPSLALVREQSVTTETLNDLLQDYTLEEGYHHLLVIEVPGLESQITQSTPAKCLQQFSGIIIRSSSEQLYQQEQQENIAELLEPAGFEYSYYENEQFSTVFNKHYFQRNNEKIALMHCNDQINELNTINSERATQATEHEQKIAELTEQQNAQSEISAEKQNQIEQLNAAKSEQTKLAIEGQQQIARLKQGLETQTELATERQQLLTKLTEKCDVQAKTATERQGQIDLSKKAAKEQSKLATKRQQQIQKLTVEFDTQVKQGQEQQTQLTSLTKKIKQLKKSISGLENELNSFKKTEDKRLQELEEAQQTASLSVKLQMLKEGDLQDLQKRYQQALVTQENQHELLNKLSERLSLAAGYFHQISQEQQIEEDKRIAQSKNKPRKGLARLLNFKRGKSS